MKIDKYIKDISDKLHNHNGNNNSIDDTIDDNYYLDRKLEPPRFLCYRHIRVKKCPDEYRKKSLDCVLYAITQDELDYALKRELRKSPEQRYQDKKEDWYLHELYIDGGEECNPMYDGCTPKCRFHNETGRIEDDEVREEYKKLSESLRQENKIVEPPSESELQRLAKIYQL